MNNREYLQTLSDEERIKTEIKQFRNIGNTHFNDINNLPNHIPNLEVYVIFNKYQDWLQSPHSTIADEDFLGIGWEFPEESSSHVEYKNYKYNRKIQVSKNNILYVSQNINFGFTDTEIDQIRKIAEKKRKEMGWGE